MDITSLAIEVKSVGISEASKALGGLTTSAGNAEKKVQAFMKAMQDLDKACLSSTTALKTNLAQLDQYTSTLQKLHGNAGGAAQSTAALTAAIGVLSSSLSNLNVNATKASSAQRTHNEAMKEAHALARGLSGSLGALWLTYGNIAGMALGVAIGASLRGVITIGKDIENTLEGIRVKGQETVESVNKIRESVLNLGKGVYGPKEVADAFEVLILAGLNAEKALVGIKDALNLATVGGTTVEKAAYTLVQVSTALGYTAEGFSRVGDVIAKTAAVSMSSVDSLSEAFKSASSVGKLYKVNLVDIGTSLALLSNLGIQGSAAGTALKNMFKELAGDSKKLKEALKLIDLKPEDLKKSTGGFKDLVEVFETLNNGLKKYGANEQDILMGRLSNERGLKLLVEGLSQYRSKIAEAGEGNTKFTSGLQALNESINKSYGFMAQGAAAMALTVDAQFKSVKNTLEVTLVKAFQGIQPELSLVATKLKDAFNSPEFISGVQNLSLAVAKLTLFLVENAGALFEIVRAVLAFKAAAAVFGLLTTIAEGFLAVTAAMRAVGIASIALQASLGVLGLALAAGAAALVWWKTKKDEAMGAKDEAAINYMDNFTDKIKENTKQINAQIDAMARGKTATDALVESQQRLALQKVKDQGTSVIAQANAARGEVLSGFSAVQKTAVRDYFDNGKKPDQFDPGAVAAVNAMIAANKNLADAEGLVARKNKEAEEALKDNIVAAKVLAEVTDKAAEKARKNAGGAEALPPDVNKARLNKEYAAAILEQNDLIAASKKRLQVFEEDETTKFKAGEIGKIQLLREVGIQHVLELEKQKTAIEQMQKLSEKKDDPAGMQRSKDMLIANEQSLTDLKKKYATDLKAHLENLERETTASQIKELEARGKYVKAAALKFSSEYSKAFDQAQADLEAYGEEFPALTENVQKFFDLQDEMIDVASFKEAKNEFDLLNTSMQNVFKGVQAESESGGIAGMFNAATAAAEEYRAKLPALIAAQKTLADSAKTPEQQTVAQQALTQIKADAEHIRTLFIGLGESISKSLEEAFGKGGKALGEMLTISIKYNESEDKTKTSRIKLYGDMTSAAKGFFKENTTGYNVLSAAEKAFRALELAQALKSFLVKSGLLTSFLVVKKTTDAAGAASTAQYTLFEVAQAGIRAAAHAVVAAVSAMAGWPFPLNMIALGATIAAIAALGVSLTGGGGGGGATAASRQAAAGTGSVFGNDNAKSESIVKSLEILEKNSGLGLAHSSNMVKYLRIVADNISGLTNLVLRTGVTSKAGSGADGKFSSYLPGPLPGSINDPLKLFGSKSSVSDLGIKANAANLSDVIAHGLNAEKYTDVNTTKKFFGITYSDKTNTQTTPLSAEVNEQFRLVIENMSKVITEAANTLGIGGDAFTEKLKTFVVDIGTISVKDLTGDEIEKQLEAVFSKLGDDMAKFGVEGLSKFQKVGEGYFETLARVANDLIQVRDVFAVLGKTLDVVGLDAVNISEGLIQAAGSLEKLTEGTKYFVDNFLTDAEKLKPIADSVNKRLQELGLSELTTIELYKKKVMALDLTNEADQKLYASLLELAPAFKEVDDAATKANEKAKQAADKTAELEMQLIEALHGAGLNLITTRKKELALLTATDAAIQQKIYDAQDRTAAANSGFAILSQSVVDAKLVAKAAFDTHMAAINKAKEIATNSFNSFKEIITKTIETAQATNSALATLASTLQSTLDSMTLSSQQGTNRQAAQELILNALATAKATGILPKAENISEALKTVSQPSEDLFSNSVDYTRDFSLTKNNISHLNDLTKVQKSNSDLQLETLQHHLDVAQKAYDAQMKGLDQEAKEAQAQLEAENAKNDSLISYAQQQLAAMNGTQIAVYSVTDAMRGFNSAVISAISAQQAARTQANYGVTATAGQNPYPQAATYNQIVDLYKNILGRAPEPSGLSFWLAAAGHGVTASSMASSFLQSPEYLSMHGSHADGLDHVPHDNYRANLHAGERVQTAKAAKDSDAVAEKLETMRLEQEARDFALIQTSKAMEKIIRLWDGNGMPPERSAT